MQRRRFFLVTLIALAVTAVAPGTASAAECWKELVNDYWADNRIDKTYPIECYREAMNKLPRDVQEYSDAQDDLRAAQLAAIRNLRDGNGFDGSGVAGGGAGGGGDDGGGSGGSAAGPGTQPDDEQASKGFFTEVIQKLGPDNADSIPVPLLVLGSIALLLVGAAGVSYGARYLQERRVAAPGAPDDPRV